jgi:S-formylglutathione hydrolase FrmB
MTLTNITSPTRKLIKFILLILGTFLLVSLASLVFAGGFIADESAYWNKGAVANLPISGNGGEIDHYALVSSHLKAPNNVVGLNVYTPPAYNAPGNTQRFPVIYLLHGILGHENNYLSYFNTSNFFTTSGSIPSYIEDNPAASQAIVVLVNGGAQSFYNDWLNSSGYGPDSPFPILSETVIMKDVIPYVDANFRTIANREGRAVEGFSMGGRGAVKLAFKYLDQFCSVIAYAGAGYEEIPPSAVGNPLIGPHPVADRMSTITAVQAACIQEQGLQIRLVDGSNDGTAGQGGGSSGLHNQLDSLGIAHEYEPNLAGTVHNWANYHQRTGEYGLNFHLQCLQSPTQGVLVTPQVPYSILGTLDEFAYLPIAQGGSTCN